MQNPDHVTEVTADRWKNGKITARLFAIAWALAVLIASFGWFYFIFRILFSFARSLLQ
jgi:hypothetical protein